MAARWQDPYPVKEILLLMVPRHRRLEVGNVFLWYLKSRPLRRKLASNEPVRNPARDVFSTNG